MEVFNKIYTQVSSSVSSTVSQLSGVLPGNPVTREFEANEHIASAGPGLLWKIYKGVKKSTKQEASIFVLEKKQLEKYSKADRDLILDVLKRGVTQLTKIRHPQILTVQHPLEESRESLAFATEPVFASLANVFGNLHNAPNNSLPDHKFYDIEMKYGLLQVGEGLAFLHNDMKLLHKNLAPESVMINCQGAWKIFGFDFCVHNTAPANSPPVYPLEEFVESLPSVSQPNLEYLAPETVLQKSQSSASDIFSFGMLCFALYSTGHQSIAKVRDLQQFKARSAQFKNLNNKLSSLPQLLQETVKNMLSSTPERRPDAHQFIKIAFFEDVGVKTLNYLDSLLQWDNLQKSHFYKGLPEAMNKLPQRVRLQRVLPCLNRELAQPAMVPFVLPSILDIGQQCSQQEFTKYVLPHLKPAMRLTEPVQILLIFLQRMELMLKQTPAEDVQQHVLPMLYRGLDSQAPQIHELCLNVLPTFAALLDHANVKNHLLPRIKKLCMSSQNLSVRVNCLLCIGRLLEHLDKWLVLDEILPFLPQIPSREPAVLMGILGIYKMTLNHKKLGISKEVMATRILPFLMPLCIENGLNLTQFNALVALVKQMFQMVESEHRLKLEQLNSVQQERKVLEAAMPDVKSPIANGLEGFTGLGLEGFVARSSAPKPQSLELLEPRVVNETTAGNSKMPAKDLSLELQKSVVISPPPNFPANFNNASLNGASNGMWNQQQQQPQKQQSWSPMQSAGKNWNALDSLLQDTGMGNNFKTTPMNQMASNFNSSSGMIMTPLSPPNNKQNVSSLSKDDIMDLLS